MKSHSKSKFTSEEDRQILDLVSKFGSENWALIASKIKGRSTRQCRERYMNYLCPSVNNSPWTDAEDKLLAEKYTLFGPHWKVIADFFPNRTDINVKNRWLRLERHRIKNNSKKIENPIPTVLPPLKKPIEQTTVGAAPKLGTYAGDTWVRFAEPLFRAVETDDFSTLNEDVLKYFKAVAL